MIRCIQPPRPLRLALRPPPLIVPCLLAALCAAGRAGAQQATVREQDELDFGRLSLAQGSGARALGMGGAFLARPDDATAASWNPAGLSYLRQPELSLVGLYGTQTIDSRIEHREIGLILKHDHLDDFAPDFASMALPLRLGSVAGSVQLSFQRVIPYSGRRELTETANAPKVIEARGGFDVLALATGLKVNRWLRVGVTVNRWFNGLHQHRERLVFRRSVQEVDFDVSGVTFNAGAIAQLSDSFNVGLVAKTRLHADVTLSRTRADYTSQSDGLPDLVATNAFSSDAVSIDLPGAVGFGASWRPASPLTLSADYTRTYWSRARIHNYFTLPPGPGAADLASPSTDCAQEPRPATCPEVFASLPFPNVVDARQGDTYEIRLGAEYVFIPGRVKVPVRAGYVAATQYRRQLTGLAPRYDGITAGVGIVVGPVLLDGAWLYQTGSAGLESARTSTRIHNVLFSLIYRHGR
jgi:hypothetical protein